MDTNGDKVDTVGGAGNNIVPTIDSGYYHVGGCVVAARVDCVADVGDNVVGFAFGVVDAGRGATKAHVDVLPSDCANGCFVEVDEGG